MKNKTHTYCTKKTGIFILFVLFLQSSLLWSQNEEKKLEEALYNLANVTFSKISKTEDPYLKYQLFIK